MTMRVGWIRVFIIGVILVMMASTCASAETGDQTILPMFENLVFPLATPLPASLTPPELPSAAAQSQTRVRSLGIRPALTATDYNNCASTADQPTQEIIDLAAALKNDPQLIFNYVYENIDLEPSLESSKGALGTYLDQSGSSFDQSNLLVTLLNAAHAHNSSIGHVQFVVGTATLTASQMGLPFLPAQLGINAGATSATIPYAWVQAVINGTTVTYNPAGKTYIVNPGSNLAQYAGAPPNAASSAVSTYLTNFSQNIYSNAHMNYTPVNIFVGGRQINVNAAPLNNMSTSGNQTFDYLPTYYRTVLQFIIDVPSGNYQNLCTDQIYGHVVTSGSGIVSVDNAQVFHYNAGTQQTLTVGLTHQYVVNGTHINWWQAATVTLHWAGWDVFNLGIGRVGRFRAQHDADIAARTMAQVAADTTNYLRPLIATSSGQLSQTTHATELLDQLAGTYTQNKHMLQIITNDQTISSPLISTTVTDVTPYPQPNPASGLVINPNAVAYALSALQSAQEAMALTQVGVPNATSAAVLLSKAVASSGPSGLQLITHTQTPPTLAGYNTAENDVIGSYLYYGYDVYVPVTPPPWNSSGPAAPFVAMKNDGTNAFVLVTPDGKIYKGAATPSTASFTSTVTAAAGQSSAAGPAGAGLSVNPSSGVVSFATPLMSIGTKNSPFALELDLSYSSAASAQKGSSSPERAGWSHNLEMSVTPSSDGFAILGSNLTGPAIPGITALYELLLNSNSVVNAYANNAPPSTSTMLVTMATAGWFVQQSTNDAVTFNRGGAQEVFAHMPDGSYRPAQPSPERLTVPANPGNYTLTTGHGSTMVFNSKGQLISITDAGGHVTSFNYSTMSTYSVLTSVTTQYHGLTFAYASVTNQCPELHSVQDETQRIVWLGYDSNNLNLKTITLIDDSTQARRLLNFGYTSVPLNYNNGTIGGSSNSMIELTSVTDPAQKQTALAYDSRLLATGLTDARSHTTSYLTAGNRSEVDDALGNASYTHTYPTPTAGLDQVAIDSYDPLQKKTTTQFNSAGQVLSKYLPDTVAPYQYAYTYDANGNLASTTTGSITTSAVYNICNLPNTTTDTLGRPTTYTYKSTTIMPDACQLSQIVHPTVDGTGNTPAPTEKFYYSYDDRLNGYVAADTQATSYTFTDKNGNLTGDVTSIVQDNNGFKLTTKYEYDAVGNAINITDPKGYTTGIGYDLARRPVQKVTPPIAAQGNGVWSTYYKYDADGRPSETDQDPGTGLPLVVTKTTYDAAGNTLTQSQPTNDGTIRNTVYTYDADNRVSTITDPAGQTVTRTYDADSRLYQVLDGNNAVSQTYAYTNDGLTHSLADGNTNAITYTYDVYDRLTTTTYADGTYEKRTLDNAGRTTASRTRASVTTTYTFDNLDRVASETDQGVATPITFTYDLVNRPLTVTDSSGIFTYQYDTAGRQKNTTRPDGKVINYTYDADSNTAAITYPDGYVYTYAYDELDRMTDVSETPAGSSTASNLAHYAYDPLSRRTSLAYGNGTSTSYGYDSYSGLTSIAHAFVGTPPGVTITYTRDANERRASDTFSPGTAYVWHPPAAATTTYQPNALNQYTSINGQTLGYGGAGNLTSDPTAPLGSATYQWDLKNRLTAAGNPQHQASYGYDAFSRRSAKTVDGVTTVFVSDGSREIADYDSAGHELVRFVYGLDNAPIVEEPVGANGAPTDTWYHHLDAIGTTVALTDHTGALYKAYATSPWGEVGGTQGTPFRFAGMRLDAETKLYYDNARYYSPQMGRFLSPDPIGTDGGINLYAYVGNDPLNGVDTTGLDEYDIYYGGGGGYYGSGYCDLFCGGGWSYGGSFPTLHSGQPSHPTTKPSSGSKSPPASGGAPNQSPPVPSPFEPTINPKQFYSYVGPIQVAGALQSNQNKNPKCGKAIMQPQYTGIFGQMGRDLSIDPLFVMSTALQESGWNLVHVFGTNSSSNGKPLNNLFGQTYGGGNNIAYPSVQASAQAWENNWGLYLQNRPQTIQNYAADLNSNPSHMYNSNPAYPGELAARYNQLVNATQACGSQF